MAEGRARVLGRCHSAQTIVGDDGRCEVNRAQGQFDAAQLCEGGGLQSWPCTGVDCWCVLDGWLGWLVGGVACCVVGVLPGVLVGWLTEWLGYWLGDWLCG